MRQLLVIFIGVRTAAVVGAASDTVDRATGLWEMTYATRIEGTQVPKSALEKLSPEQDQGRL